MSLNSKRAFLSQARHPVKTERWSREGHSEACVLRHLLLGEVGNDGRRGTCKRCFFPAHPASWVSTTLCTVYTPEDYTADRVKGSAGSCRRMFTPRVDASRSAGSAAPAALRGSGLSLPPTPDDTGEPEFNVPRDPPF